MANIHDLPQEIIHDILRFASYRWDSGGRFVHLPALCRAALVHPAWRRSAQQLLTEDVTFGPVAHGPAHDRDELFLSNAAKGWSCQNLRLWRQSDERAMAILDSARVGGVKSLSLMETACTTQLLSHPSLNRLESLSVGVGSRCEIDDNFAGPRSIKRLHVDPREEYRKLLTAFAPNLTTMAVSFASDSEVELFETLAPKLNNVTELDLYMDTHYIDSDWLLSSSLKLIELVPEITILRLRGLTPALHKELTKGLVRKKPLLKLESSFKTKLERDAGRYESDHQDDLGQIWVAYVGFEAFVKELKECAKSVRPTVVDEWQISVIGSNTENVFSLRRVWTKHMVDQWAQLENQMAKQRVKLAIDDDER